MSNNGSRKKRVRDGMAILEGRKKRRGTADGLVLTPDQRFNLRVEKLCLKRRVKNPIEEVELAVESVSFEYEGTTVNIPGSPHNRTARLFFEDYLRDLKRDPHQTHTLTFHHVYELKRAAADFFQDRWDDAEAMGSSLLTAFKKATTITVHGKDFGA